MFAGIGDDDQFARGRCDNFFIKERAAAPFDQIEMRIEFVGAVDGDVDVLDFVETGERDAELGRHFACVVRSGDAADF